jgi:hypothetical protein
MKVVFALFAATALTAVAQDAPKPQMRGGGPGPAPVTAPSTEPGTTSSAAAAKDEGIGLIPETLEPVPKPKGEELLPSLPMSETPRKIDKTTAAEDELNLKIRFRELKTKLERDAKVAELADRAAMAKSDFEKREALKAYYETLYGKIAKLEPKLQKRAFEARDRYIRRMAQTQISPTQATVDNERFAPE